MHTLSTRIINRRPLALVGIVALFLTGSVAAADNSDVAPPPAKKPDVAPSEKIADKPAETPKRITQSRDDSVLLTARDATVHGAKLRYEPQKNTLGYWFSADDWVSWDFEITHPAKLFVDLTQSCGPDSAGSHYTVSVGDQVLNDKVQETSSFRVFRLRRIGTLQFDKPGIYTLSIRVLDMPRLAVMDLRAVTLKPPKPEKPAAASPGGAKPAPDAPAVAPRKASSSEKTIAPEKLIPAAPALPAAPVPAKSDG